jgi:hypothetical protein
LSEVGRGIYRLDSRHLSGKYDDDLKARIESEKEFALISRKKAQQGHERLPSALEYEASLREEAQKSFKF